jgi:hypothetical protein
MLIRQFHGRHYRNKGVAFATFPPRHFGRNRPGMTVRTHVARISTQPPIKMVLRLAVLVVVKVLVMVPPVSFWFWVANATLALAESGVCKRQAPSPGPEEQRGLRAPSRETASVFLGGRRLTRAEGQRP